MNLMRTIIAGAGALALAACATVNDDMADTTPVLAGGAQMYPDRTIAQNAAAAPDLSTLVTALQAADLVDTLNTPGPFTVFAPTNQAFQQVPAATLNSLLEPANKAQLQSVLTYHVVAGRVTAEDLIRQIRAGNGSAMITTLQGEQLTARMSGSNVVLMGKNGSMATVIAPNVTQSNGVVHVINGVLLPTM